MSPAYFNIEGMRARPSALASGPWSPEFQHGGGPAGLVAWAAEQFASPRLMRRRCVCASATCRRRQRCPSLRPIRRPMRANRQVRSAISGAHFLRASRCASPTVLCESPDQQRSGTAFAGLSWPVRRFRRRRGPSSPRTSSNGTSAPLDPAIWTFPNSDITLELERDPVGGWILVDANTRVGPAGSGLAVARLADAAGTFGRASLCLVINKR